MGDRYYKVTAEALRVCSGMIPVIRPAAGGGAYDYKPAAAAMYTGVLSRLNAQDQCEEPPPRDLNPRQRGRRRLGLREGPHWHFASGLGHLGEGGQRRHTLSAASSG